MNVTSAAFNTDFDDMIAYSGNEMIFIKSGNQPPLSQKYNGDVKGFKSSKMFVLNNAAMQTIDVS